MKSTNQEMHPLYGIAPDDAIDMLIADHKRVANLFADFKRLTDLDDEKAKARVVELICQELTVHAQLEEELFYPAVREVTGDEDQVDEAVVEHAGAKFLIAQLQSADPEEELFDAKVTVLGEQINHHVEEEEGSMFPKARHSGLDAAALGARMLARKAELQGGPAAAVRPPDSDELDEDEEEAQRAKPRRKAPPPPAKKQASAAKAKPAKSKTAKSKAKRR